MSWVDDLRSRAEQAFEDVGIDINAYLKKRESDAVMKILEPTGNLSQAQLDAGQRGGTAATAAPSGANGNNAMVAGQITESFMKYLPFIAIGAITFLLIGKKRRG